MQILSLFLSVTAAAAAVFSDEAPLPLPLERRQAYGMVGSGFDGPVKTLGNAYNYWKVLDNGTVDLTRADVMGVTAPRVMPMRGSRPAVLIEPNRTVLCIIDMQNTFRKYHSSPATDPRLSCLGMF